MINGIAKKVFRFLWPLLAGATLLGALSFMACSWMPLDPSASPTPTASPFASPAPLASKAPALSLPVQRGFNLLELFYRDPSKPVPAFLEEDFATMRDLGFDFVRLPMDYRIWIDGSDWYKVKESVLAQIDQAVAWGQEYGVHVCINFHRAPGYTVASPPEATSVWTDQATLDACAWHWRLFARRYKDVPPDNLSFNLFNEPSGVSQSEYLRVVQVLVNTIHLESPDRPVFIDGLDYGATALDVSALSDPFGNREGLLGLSFHCYEPFNLTHYLAEWISGSSDWALPSWPAMQVPALFYGPGKPDWQDRLVITGSFPAGTVVRIHAGTVSDRVVLGLYAAGMGTELTGTGTEPGTLTQIWSHDFDCKSTSPEWESASWKPQWGIWQNLWNKDYSITLAAPASRLELGAGAGDWMTVPELGIRIPGSSAEIVLPLDSSAWGTTHKDVSFDGQAFSGGDTRDRQWLRQKIAPFAAARAQGIPVMVQEFGTYNKTPHADTLRWMADLLTVLGEANLGWAQWNLRGSFGILDSGRADVDYEAYGTHLLDRTMLDILQQH